MSQVHVGFDIGSRFMHMVVWNGHEIKNAVTEVLPEGLTKDGRVVSAAAMGEFLKEIRKKHKLRPMPAAVVLHERECYCRRAEVPSMTDQQLRVNLPYEFKDFITGDKDKFYYDYAVLGAEAPTEKAPVRKPGKKEAEPASPFFPQPASVDPTLPAAESAAAPAEEKPEVSDAETVPEADSVPRLDLVVAAVSKATIETYREVMLRSGFVLKVAVPDEMAYMNALRKGGSMTGSVCLLDLGHSNVRIYMFSDGKYTSSRSLDYGCSSLDTVIAGQMDVDPFVAVEYRERNYQNCQELQGCMSLYNGMAFEVVKAINYYNFSEPDKPLDRVLCCGGGMKSEPLVQALRDTLPIPVTSCAELIPDVSAELLPSVSLTALGAAMQRG